MRFSIIDVAQITTGISLSGEIKSVYDILNFMTGENLYTHQLIRAGNICRDVLLERFPELKDIDASNVTKENSEAFCKELENKYGIYREVEKLEDGVYLPMDPLLEIGWIEKNYKE